MSKYLVNPDLLILPLAVWQTIEILHHSELCYPVKGWIKRTSPFAEKVYSCPFCLSIWIGFLYTGLRYMSFFMPLFFAQVVCSFMLALAVSRLANLGNDLTKDYCRTPRFEPEEAQGTPNGNENS